MGTKQIHFFTTR